MKGKKEEIPFFLFSFLSIERERKEGKKGIRKKKKRNRKEIKSTIKERWIKTKVVKERQMIAKE